MGSPFHESFRALLNTTISDWLHDIRRGHIESNEVTRDVVKLLKDKGTPTFSRMASATNTVDKGAPDGMFKHRDCSYPGLVIEVAWSHLPISLRDYAHLYIGGGNNETRTFVGVDLNAIYMKRSKATASFSIWRASFDNLNGETKTVMPDVDKQVPTRKSSRNSLQQCLTELNRSSETMKAMKPNLRAFNYFWKISYATTS